MDNNTILLIINLIISTLIPIISNFIQTIIQLCLKRVRRSSCLGSSFETYDPEKSMRRSPSDSQSREKEIKPNIV